MVMTLPAGSGAQHNHPFHYQLVQRVSQGLCCISHGKEYILLNSALQYVERRVCHLINEASSDFHLCIFGCSLPFFYSGTQLDHLLVGGNLMLYDVMCY